MKPILDITERIIKRISRRISPLAKHGARPIPKKPASSLRDGKTKFLEEMRFRNRGDMPNDVASRFS